MDRIYLAHHPEAQQDIGLEIALIAGETPDILNDRHAYTIETALAATDSTDRQARVMACLYRTGIIPPELMDDVPTLVNALDVADDLMRRVYDLEERPGSTSPIDSDRLKGTLHGIGFDPACDITLIDRDGFISTHISPDGASEIVGGNDVTHLITDDDEVLTQARKLGISHYAYVCELTWRPDGSDVLRPALLSKREHTALGRLGVDGAFEPILTVISRDHPARSID